MTFSGTWKSRFDATGEQHAVRDFARWAAEDAGFKVEFRGEGPEEQGIVTEILDPERAPAVAPGDVVIEVDPRYFRPTEVDTLLGDASRARTKLGWEPTTTARQMCREMVDHDLIEAQKQAHLVAKGFKLSRSAPE